MRTLWIVLNLFAMAAFLSIASLVTVWPGQLSRLHMTYLDGQIVLMQLISLLFLLAYLHRHLGRAWRWFTLTSSFLVLGESILMSGLFLK